MATSSLFHSQENCFRKLWQQRCQRTRILHLGPVLDHLGPAPDQGLTRDLAPEPVPDQDLGNIATGNVMSAMSLFKLKIISIWQDSTFIFKTKMVRLPQQFNII